MKRYPAYVVFPIITVMIFGLLYAFFKSENGSLSSLSTLHLELLRKNLDKAFIDDNFEWPQKIQDGDNTYVLDYTFNKELLSYAEMLLKKHSADYSSIAIIDNNTGEILASVGFEKKTKELINYLPFTSTHPSASLFKIVTAADLLKTGEIDGSTKFNYKGRGTTLYKYQLDNKKFRNTREITFKKAFAQSNNVVFAQAAITKTTGLGIFKTATDFGFNKNLMNEITLPKSIFMMPENQYNLAEMASGFNKQTLISPVHGALLSSVIANRGVLKYPRIIRRVLKNDDMETVWENSMREKRILEYRTTDKIQEMMHYAAVAGTARAIGRKMRSDIRDFLNIGAKTGSITGGLPYGKRDWLTLYASPKNDQGDAGISICIMNINIRNWYVKSTYLATKILEYYYGKLFPQKIR